MYVVQRFALWVSTAQLTLSLNTHLTRTHVCSYFVFVATSVHAQSSLPITGCNPVDHRAAQSFLLWDRFADVLTIWTATVRRRLIFPSRQVTNEVLIVRCCGPLVLSKSKKEASLEDAARGSAERHFQHMHTTLSKKPSTRQIRCGHHEAKFVLTGEVCTADVLLVPYTCLWCFCDSLLAVASSQSRRKFKCCTIRLMPTGRTRGFKHRRSARCARALHFFLT